jgi:hypothetical protein
MDNIITEIKDYCAARKITATYLGLLVMKNGYIFPRLERRLASIERDKKRIRDYIAANPPKVT